MKNPLSPAVPVNKLSPLPDPQLGETYTPPIPFVHRMDNPRPIGVAGPGVRRYFEKPVPFPGAKLVRIDVLYSTKGLTAALARNLTLTLTDIHGDELHRDLPLTLLSPIYKTKQYRTRYFRPFAWDPYKSYVSQVGPVSVNVNAELLAYFIR